MSTQSKSAVDVIGEVIGAIVMIFAAIFVYGVYQDAPQHLESLRATYEQTLREDMTATLAKRQRMTVTDHQLVRAVSTCLTERAYRGVGRGEITVMTVSFGKINMLNELHSIDFRQCNEQARAQIAAAQQRVVGEFVQDLVIGAVRYFTSRD